MGSVACWNVRLEGTTPVLFDRYGGNNNEQLKWQDKCYKNSKGNLILPATNLMSFLSAQNTESAPRRLMGKRWGAVAKAALSFANISPFEIPFSRDGKPIPATECTLHTAVARVKKGSLAIPNPKERPMLDTPWAVEFKIQLYDNPDLSPSVLEKLFREGGIAIGIGTFRGVFGKFVVAKWDAEK